MGLSPWATMVLRELDELAALLVDQGVDGFPLASDGRVARVLLVEFEVRHSKVVVVHSPKYPSS